MEEKNSEKGQITEINNGRKRLTERNRLEGRKEEIRRKRLKGMKR